MGQQKHLNYNYNAFASDTVTMDDKKIIPPQAYVAMSSFMSRNCKL
jgi:hypothetical protein